MKFKLPLAMAAIAFAVPAHASIETLITIPIADILGHREGLLNYYATGNERNIDKGYSHDGYIIVGLFDKMEIAADTDFNGTTTFHAKVLLLESEEKAPLKYAVSGGIQNFQGGTSADTFLVGRIDFKNFRLHGGVMHDTITREFVGVDFTIFKDWTALAETTTGEHGYSWVGISVPIKQVAGLSFLIAGGIPNTKGDGVQHTLGFTYGFKF